LKQLCGFYLPVIQKLGAKESSVYWHAIVPIGDPQVAGEPHNPEAVDGSGTAQM